MLKELVFGLSPGAAAIERDGPDEADPGVRLRLEKILQVFVAGYNVALTVDGHDRVSDRLSAQFDGHHVGFAFEGAGMCYALFDLLMPWTSSRLRAFTDRAGRRHDYIATVGAGFAVARVPWGVRGLRRYLERLDAATAWCVFDGYGFHQGVFHRDAFVDRGRACPAAIPAYGRALFDSGVGRSLWWTTGAAPAAIGRAIDRFPESRRAAMWCGIGIAASYAGGVDERCLGELRHRSGACAADFLSGVPFAARMRQKGANPSPWTDRACRILLRRSAEQAADLIVDQVNDISAELQGRGQELRETGYARLRHRLRDVFERQLTQDDELSSVRVADAGRAYGQPQ